MRPTSYVLRSSAALVFALLLSAASTAQAPPSLQFFMPDGALPSRELRFTMTSDNGRVETYFTDSKGRFLITPSLGLKPDAEYKITIQGDGRTFDTTSVTFKQFGVYYIPIFLRRLRAAAPQPARVVDLAEFDLRTPDEARQAYTSAMRSMKEGQAEDAIRELERALTIYPDYFRALNDLGVIYSRLNRLEPAARMFERAIKLAPHVYYPKLNLAIVETRRARYKEALALLEPLYKTNQALTEVRIALADALMAVNRLDEAEPHLVAATSDTKLDPATAGDAHYKLGLLLNRKQRYEAAIKELNRAAEALPNAARIHLQLGGALLQVNRLDDAERELLAAYRIGGAEMGGAQLMLGQIYYIEKRYDRALQAFEQYLADVPQAPNGSQVRGVIEKIKGAMTRK